MIEFVKYPNLPQGKVKTIICGELCDELNGYLDSIDIERLTIEPNADIDSAVKYHADMAAIYLGTGQILLDDRQHLLGEKLLTKGFGVHYTEKCIKGEYPDDIALNFTIIGNIIIGRLDCADKRLIELVTSFDKINVRQGYCKCSCLVVSDNAVITDDESIYKALCLNGVDALLISKGDIVLNGHNYGFIGGASCKISESEVLFFGDITKHRDYKKIADFIEKHGCEIIFLDFPLTDFGGIIPITEKAP